MFLKDTYEKKICLKEQEANLSESSNRGTSSHAQITSANTLKPLIRILLIGLIYKIIVF